MSLPASKSGALVPAVMLVANSNLGSSGSLPS